MELISDISINVILLFGLVYIMTLPKGRFDFYSPFVNVLIGTLIGVITIITMMNAFELTQGAFFDARSVIIAVTTLFFPTLTAFIASFIAILFRVYVGGVGVYAGTLSIIFSFLGAYLWKQYVLDRLKINRFLHFYLFGLVIHVFVVLSQLTFPYPQNIGVIINIGPIMLLVYPIATMLLSIAMVAHQTNLENQKLLAKSEKRYRTLINSSKLGIIQYDTSGVIELSNDAFADILKTNTSELKGLNMLSLLNKKVVACVKDSIAGVKSSYEGNYQSAISGYELPVRAQFSPVYDHEKVIGGICILEDLTHEKNQQKIVNRLKKTDQLTQLYNRLSFDEIFSLSPSDINYPFSIIILDINTFQLFNTTFGYEKGNEALRLIASCILRVIKPYENVKAYRTGGDEFSLICYGLNKTAIKTLIKAIQKNIDQTQNYSIELIIGFGYGIAKNSNKSITETFNEANTYLQQNKVYAGSSTSTKTVDIIMSTLFEKSKREKNHSERVSLLSGKIAEKFSKESTFINRVKLAARLHDIGKINISETILDKPGKLTNKEYQSIKHHPTSGYKILSSVPEYLHIANIVYCHHERIDGLGYPRGLKNIEIPLEARIIAVADAFDAMKEPRTYRQTFTKKDAIEEIKAHAGTQFDEHVVESFLEIMNTQDSL